MCNLSWRASSYRQFFLLPLSFRWELRTKREREFFPFNGNLPDFLYGPIKVFIWEQLFRGETKARLDVVNMFYDVKYHLVESFATVEGKKVPFITKEINKLYGLSNNLDDYPGQRIITKPIKNDMNSVSPGQTCLGKKRQLRSCNYIHINWQ